MAQREKELTDADIQKFIDDLDVSDSYLQPEIDCTETGQ